MSEAKTKPHDALFRRVFSDPAHAEGELKLALPEALVKLVDWSTLQVTEDSYIDTELRELSSDLVFRVDLDGKEAFVYVLVEHQSSVDLLMGHRLLRYMTRLWEGWLKVHPEARRAPAIVPLVVHHSGKAWSAPMVFEELLDLTPEALAAIADYLPRFTYLVDDLSEQRVEDLANRAMTALSRLVLICLARARPSDDILHELDEVRELLDEVLAAPDAVAAFAAILSYILQATDVEPDRVGEFSRQLGPKAVEAYMTGAQQIEERGRKQGRKQGLAEGQLLLLIAQAERRFGPLAPDQRATLEHVSPEETLTLAERILDAKTFDDLFAD